MEATLPLEEITVKQEPMDSENVVKIEQNDNNQDTEEVQEDELWIKTEPYDEDSQDAANGTVSENEAKLDEEALNDESNRNRQSHAPSRKQIRVLLDFLNEHRDLANCKLRGTPDGRVRANQLWQTITVTLNSIGPCTKTIQQWQRVWTDKKYLTRKAAAARFAFLTAGNKFACASELTPQDEKILAILDERIPRKGDGLKSATPEPKSQTLQDISVTSLPLNRESKKIEIDPKLITLTEQLPLHPEVTQLPGRTYTPRMTDSSRIDELPGKTSVPLTLVILPTNVLSQPDAFKTLDDPPKPRDQKFEELPSSACISDPPSSSIVQQESIPQAQRRPRARLGSYRNKFIHLERERLKNDAKRNAELTRIHHSIERGNTELAGIKNAIQEMVALMKQLTEKRRDDK